MIDKMLREEVIKRDAIEGPEADAAARRVVRSADKRIGKGSEKEEPVAAPVPAPV